MKILFVASECAPFAKVGGLADVVGSLPKSLKKIGTDVSVLIPFYDIIGLDKKELKLVLKESKILFGGKEDKFNLWQTHLPESDVPLFLIEHAGYFRNGVYPESDASSGGGFDETRRFLFLSLVATEIARSMKFDILHCQDWQTAIAPLLLREKHLKIKTLLTIHNLAYQGIFSHLFVNDLLGTSFSEDVNCLKLGILNADYINTVSPSYREEILTPELGFGLEKNLEKRKDHLEGILNGLDEDQFSPEKDTFLDQQYSWNNIDSKAKNKIYLQNKCFKKADLNVPLIGVVHRLAEQKGIDLIMEIFPALMEKNIQFVLLGEGVGCYENFFVEAARDFPEKCFVRIAFDEELAHQIYAGADIFLMPSHFEPCGLGQQIAMKYGTLPVARATGGIKDTVVPVKIAGEKAKGAGFLFQNYSADDFLRAIETALALYNKKKNIWQQIQTNGMKQDFSWKKSSEKYKALYRKILENEAP